MSYKPDLQTSTNTVVYAIRAMAQEHGTRAAAYVALSTLESLMGGDLEEETAEYIESGYAPPDSADDRAEVPHADTTFGSARARAVLAAIPAGEEQPISALLDELAAYKGLIDWIRDLGALPSVDMMQFHFGDGIGGFITIAEADPEAAALLAALSEPTS